MMNLHNHTTYSDGKFSPRDIVEAAIRAGLSAVGISDHYRTTRVRSVAPSNMSGGWPSITRTRYACSWAWR